MANLGGSFNYGGKAGRGAYIKEPALIGQFLQVAILNLSRLGYELEVILNSGSFKGVGFDFSNEVINLIFFSGEIRNS